MRPIVLRTNATAVYRFLSLIRHELDEGDSLEGKSILDCGAGGPLPPAAVFAEQGMEAHGIDINERQLGLSRAFCDETGLIISLQKADMRALPYADATFDYVYEHYSICHLDSDGTTRALAEMRRVLKRSGTAFIGLISSDSWPLSSYGSQRRPGEYWMVEDGEERFHAVFTDRQADDLVADWEIVQKEKAVLILRGQGLDTTQDAWRALHPEARDACSEAEWMARYPERGDFFTYVHVYYMLRKP